MINSHLLNSYVRSTVFIILKFMPTPFFFFFFLNDPAPTEFYPLPLPDALPIGVAGAHRVVAGGAGVERRERLRDRRAAVALVGLPVDGVPDGPLAVDEGAARFLGRFWAFAAKIGRAHV